jgi:hypothetical protein
MKTFKASFYRGLREDEKYKIPPLLETVVFESRSLTSAKKDAQAIAKHETWRLIAIDPA